MMFRHSLLSTLLVLGAAFAPLALGNLNFGDHATDQCDTPIATITNQPGLNVFPPRSDNGICDDPQGICLGDCVRVIVNAGGSKGTSLPINVIVGGALPDPGDCSPIAAQRNEPVGWDFTHTGMCGQANHGEGYWHNCLVHDVCVWARCTDDEAIPGGFSIGLDGLQVEIGGGINDEFCGFSFEHAMMDFIYANSPVLTCLSDLHCPDPMICRLTECTFSKAAGEYCDQDGDCQGYCEMLRCWDGKEGDRCGKNSDCDGDLTCFGAAGSARCARQKGEGAQCGSDADCLGYCQFLRCWDGSKGDKCKYTSDCQEGLRCKKRCFMCAQKTCE